MDKSRPRVSGRFRSMPLLGGVCDCDYRCPLCHWTLVSSGP